MTIDYRIQRYFHHPDSHPHSHAHDHQGMADGDVVENKKSGARQIQVVRRVLDVNEKMANENRRFFNEKKVFTLNVMSSPGSGKTMTLERTISMIMEGIKTAIIVGDICTTNDADRLARTGAPVVQINTDEFGGDCHLAAHVIERSAASIDLDPIDLLIVENIGNLVCPAEFDIGEDARAVVLSVTEGEDKPLKYPLMFRECDIALLNKTDLLPYLDFDIKEAVRNIHQVHPGMPVFEISAKTGEGFDPWIDWIKQQVLNKTF